ncbi:hypothetical protein ACFV1L_21870 [Kitasatospora sp. NPDC059646]|uniref:hypothetical protein n=1 Tax=Kitasatospora sp. NPDC059646 TaxID=3346893 RepID=UPI0036A6BB97
MTEETGPAGAGVRESVREALALAGPRVRVVDDHMFRPSAEGRASFRLQLFTGEGLRPVAVATQTMYEGMGLTNAAEEYAAAVWERHCAEQELPPLWIQRQLYDSGMGLRERFELVTFGRAERFELGSPGWRRISAEQVAELVGGPVAEDRGEGYVPWEPLPEPRSVFEVLAVRRLADPKPFREPGCMPVGAPRWVRWCRRWWRQAVPRRDARECCWYHGGDWHAVNEWAIGFLAEGEAAGVAAEDMADFVDERAVAAGASRWQREALESVFALSVAIVPNDDFGYVNGQHRARAMMDAGVRRTVVARDVWLEDS